MNHSLRDCPICFGSVFPCLRSRWLYQSALGQSTRSEASPEGFGPGRSKSARRVKVIQLLQDWGMDQSE